MENPTTWRYCLVRSPALDRTELMVGNGANIIRAVHFHSIRSSGTLRLSLTGGCRERCPGLSQFVTLQPSIQFVPLRVSSDTPHAASLKFSWRSVFELRDCRPSGSLRARRTTLIWFAPFV
jgi:hypothetical protein